MHPFWIYLIAVVIVIISWVVAKFVDFILSYFLKVVVKKTKTVLDDILISAIRVPVYYLILIGGITISANIITLPSPIRDIIDKILSSVLIGISCYIAALIINIFIKTWFTERKAVTGRVRGEALVVISRKILNFIVFIILLILILKLWGVQVAALLASLGIAGFILGFALKDTFANMFGGIALIADRSFKIGDFIRLESGEEGEIIDIGLRSTRLKSFEAGNEIIIPNSVLVMSKITNFGRPLISLKMVVKTGVAYGSDINQVKRILLGILSEIEGVLKKPSPQVYFMEMADFSLNFNLVFWIKDYRKRFNIKDEVISQAYQKLQEAGIKIPFPTRTIYMEK